MAYQPTAIHAGELPWTGLAQDEYRFRAIFAGLVIALMAIASIIPFLSLPQVSRQDLETVPPRLAKIILEQRAQVKPPEPKPQPQATLPPPPPPTGIERPKPEPRKPLTQAEQRARQRVQTQGIGALSSELAALADSSNISSMAPARVTTSGKNTQAATVDTGILTAQGGRATTNPGAKSQAHVGTVDTIKLDDNRKESTQALLASKGEVRGGTAREGGTGARGSSGRAEEDVAVVMDKYKALLYTIYNRARRTNPGLKGKIVLVITILPSGEVANVVTKSNELNAPDLEAALLARIRQFNFGVSKGGPLTVTVPVEFLPS